MRSLQVRFSGHGEVPLVSEHFQRRVVHVGINTTQPIPNDETFEDASVLGHFQRRDVPSCVRITSNSRREIQLFRDHCLE